MCCHPQVTGQQCPVGDAASSAPSPQESRPVALDTLVVPTLPEIVSSPFAKAVEIDVISSASCSSSGVADSMVSARQEPEYNATFVKDINIFDGTVIQAGSQFLKIWELSNTGPTEWPVDTVLQYVGGDRMFTDSDVDVSKPKFKIILASVGESVCVTADLKAPALPGRYISYVFLSFVCIITCFLFLINYCKFFNLRQNVNRYWRLVAPSGERFGHRVWCE